MNKETQKRLMFSMVLWDTFDESLASIDERELRHRMKYLFSKLAKDSNLLRKQFIREGIINQEEDDYEKVKDELAELVFNNLNKIE